MGKRYVSNDTDRTIFVGGVMIPPQQGREVDEQFLPPQAPVEDAAAVRAASETGEGHAADTDPDAQRLQANLAEMLAQPLRVLLPTLGDASDDTLAALQALEQAAATPRVTLLNAIGELQLQRAQARTGSAT